MSNVKPIGRFWVSVALYLSVALLLGGGYAAWHYYDAPPLQRYAPLLARMTAHQITADDNGMIHLEKIFPGLTPKDVAYITWRADGSFVAMFPTYYGEGAQMAALLYTSRPLTDDDTHAPEGSMNFAQRLIRAGPYGNLLLEKQIDPAWYHVSYKLR